MIIGLKNDGSGIGKTRRTHDTNNEMVIAETDKTENTVIIRPK